MVQREGGIVSFLQYSSVLVNAFCHVSSTLLSLWMHYVVFAVLFYTWGCIVSCLQYSSVLEDAMCCVCRTLLSLRMHCIIFANLCVVSVVLFCHCWCIVSCLHNSSVLEDALCGVCSTRLSFWTKTPDFSEWAPSSKLLSGTTTHCQFLQNFYVILIVFRNQYLGSPGKPIATLPTLSLANSLSDFQLEWLII